MISPLRQELERIWNTESCRFPCHTCQWNISHNSYVWLYGIYNLVATKGRMNMRRTLGQVARLMAYRQETF